MTNGELIGRCGASPSRAFAMTSEEAGQRPRPTFLEQDGQDASLLAVTLRSSEAAG
jgi:hypothetical protein